METRKEEVMQAISRGWCSEKNSGKTMDSDLAMAITDEVMKLPCFAELNIEQEMSRMYDGSENERLKLDILMNLNCLRITFAEMKDAEEGKAAKPV